MLQRILRELAGGHVHSQLGLAASLEISEELVVQMLRDLEGMGYLELKTSGCDQGSCANCPLRGGCPTEEELGIWILTEKGRRAAGKGT